MPGRSKRQKQLEEAREAKCQKRKADTSQDSNPGEAAQPDQVSERDGNDSSTAPSTDPSDHDKEENSDGEVDSQYLIEEYTRNWVDNLDRDDLKSLSIALHHLLVTKLQLKKTDASVLIAEITGKGERTVREWRATFTANKGSFPDTLQGKYQRTGVLWQNEELNKLATRYVRENRVVKGQPNMRLQSFTYWVNEALLPNHGLEPGFPRKVSCETARKWLHELGFSIIDAKKGTYVDGHERDDVVEYRAQFLRRMVGLGFLNRENAPTPEAKLALPEDLETPRAAVLAKTIVLFHDESTFQANDFKRTQWGTKDDHMLVPKSKGAGIMVSDFISEQDGYLKLTDEEFTRGKEKYPRLKQYGRRSIEYGENRDGYWTSERAADRLRPNCPVQIS